MMENSGFLNNEMESPRISASFSEVEILGRSASNIYGRANRFGKRWFFKGVANDAPDAPAARQRLLKEFDIQIGLVHTGVARIISFENIEGVGECIIAEWIEGESLADSLAGGALTRDARARIFAEIVDAVSYIHSQGIVHRDLKPANIMIRSNGQSAVLIDFGLADTDTHLYQKTPAGTEGYASLRQHTAVTPFTGDDIHALGVIMPQLCPELSAIGRRCREGRYPTADALRRAIEGRRRRRRSAWIGAAAMLMLGLTAGLATYTASLQSNLTAMTDTVASLRSASQADRDSLVVLNRQLENETAIRLAAERRQQQIEELKAQIAHRLDLAFAEFCKTEDPTDPDHLSIVRLFEVINKAKDEALATESLSDAESAEVILSYTNHTNAITEKWNQILARHRRHGSAD